MPSQQISPGGVKIQGTPNNVGTWQPVAATSGTDSACTNGTLYYGSIWLDRDSLVTGIQYLIGSVGGTDKVIVSLHDESGAVLANSATAGTTVGTAANAQAVPFTVPYKVAGPATLYIGLTFNGTTAKFRTVPAHCQVGSNLRAGSATQTFGTVAAITISSTAFTADNAPVASLY